MSHVLGARLLLGSQRRVVLALGTGTHIIKEVPSIIAVWLLHIVMDPFAGVACVSHLWCLMEGGCCLIWRVEALTLIDEAIRTQSVFSCSQIELMSVCLNTGGSRVERNGIESLSHGHVVLLISSSLILLISHVLQLLLELVKLVLETWVWVALRSSSLN